MSVAALVLIGTIITALSGVTAVLLKNHKSSPDSRTADAQAWNLLNGSLQQEVERQGREREKERVAQEERSAKQDAKISLLVHQVKKITQVERTLEVAMAYIHELVKALEAANINTPRPPHGLDVWKLPDTNQD